VASDQKHQALQYLGQFHTDVSISHYREYLQWQQYIQKGLTPIGGDRPVVKQESLEPPLIAVSANVQVGTQLLPVSVVTRWDWDERLAVITTHESGVVSHFYSEIQPRVSEDGDGSTAHVRLVQAFVDHQSFSVTPGDISGDPLKRVAILAALDFGASDGDIWVDVYCINRGSTEQ